jgi:hypothetical protein
VEGAPAGLLAPGARDANTVEVEAARGVPGTAGGMPGAAGGVAGGPAAADHPEDGDGT